MGLENRGYAVCARRNRFDWNVAVAGVRGVGSRIKRRFLWNRLRSRRALDRTVFEKIPTLCPIDSAPGAVRFSFPSPAKARPGRRRCPTHDRITESPLVVGISKTNGRGRRDKTGGYRQKGPLLNARR